MTHNQRIYLCFATVFIVAGILLLVGAVKNIAFLQVLATIPLVGSLVSVLVQVLRDEAAYQRDLLLQSAQNQFILGASSHMANVAFDKHSEFSEEYAEEVHKALDSLFREGPSDDVLKHAYALHQTRRKYIVWLTAELEAALDPFEDLYRKIGANSVYVNVTTADQGRQAALNRMYSDFAKALGMHEWDGEQLTDDLAIAALVRKLRDVLGTEELTRLRVAIVNKASKELI